MKKVLLALFALCFASRLWAISSVPYTEGVSFSFRISGAGSGTMTVMDESPVAVSVNRDTTGAVVESDIAVGWLRPGKQYSVNFSGNGPSEFWLSFVAPEGYVLLINDSPTTLIDQTTGGGSFSYPYLIELVPMANYQPALFGNFSGIQIGRSVSWEIGLGTLQNGRSAGRIIFKEYDLTNSPVSRDRLYYVPPASHGEIGLVKDGPVSQTLRQVYVPQGMIDIVDDPGGNGYSFNFYTYASTLWKTIRVELSSGNLKITDTEGTTSQVSLLSFTAGAAGYGTGGSLTTSGGYNIHTFTSVGTFTATGNLYAEMLLVAGGGGGGGGNALPGTMNGGGGGAGGAIDKTIAIASDSYSVTVGAGGAANTNGGDSTFFSLAAKGGGAGATGSHLPASSGGNGGGQGNLPGGSIGYGIWGQGFNGGAGMSGWPLAGGGGGGGGAAGGTPNGGAGFSSSISGTATYYAGGGGGGSNDPSGGAGGIGGGGAGGGSSGPNGSSGAANTGGGGGGCNTGTAGSGGAGIVIIKYPTSPAGVISGNYTWTLQEGDGSTWLRTTTHTSLTHVGYRDDTVEVRTGGISDPIVATTRYRYHDFGWGEEIQQITAIPGAGLADLTTTYDYYTAVGLPITNPGNYRQLKSVTTPDGNWTAYQYWDDWDRRGHVVREYHPYLDSPSSVSFNYLAGRVIYMDYTPDWTGHYNRPEVRQETVNNVVTGETIWTHGDSTVSGLPHAFATIQSYQDGSHYQNDYIESYRGDAIAEERNRRYLTTGANQTQTSFCDGSGSFNSGTGVFTYSSSGGPYYREFQVQGSTNSSGATSISSWGGQSFAPIYLIAYHSTVSATIRDIAGNVIRTENWAYTGGSSFVLLNFENMAYDFAGRLTQRVASNNATVDIHYASGRVDYMVDPTGVQTEFTYDQLGRVATSTKMGAAAYGSYPAQGDIVTTNTYDGVDHVTQTVTAGPGLSVTNQTYFDQAGRINHSVANVGSTANVLTTGYDYSVNPRTVKITLPGGATKITETYYDGQLKHLLGSGVVSQDVTPSVDSGTGQRLVQTVSGGISANAVTTYWDWLGHQIQEVRPGWSGSNVSRVSTYNSSGQLAKYTQPGMADTLFEYDTMGAKTRQGLDTNANGALDNASDDRIMGQSNYIYTWDSGASWWNYNGEYTYATSGSPTPTTGSQSKVRLNNATNYLDQRSSWDIYGNETLQTTIVDRANKKVTIATAYPDSATSSVQITYNGLLMESTDKAGVKMTYGYDVLGRQTSSVDPRLSSPHNATTTSYIAGTNLVDHVTDPAGTVQATYIYDAAGRVKSVADGLGKSARYEYNDRNQKIHEFGDTTYPVEYTYNSLGQQIGMTTFAQSSTTFTGTDWPTTAPDHPQTTTWHYNDPTGLLSSKVDADSKSISYTYTDAGQVLTKTSARGIVTNYDYYAGTGELHTVSYSDSTPGVTYVYNRLGQLHTAGDTTTGNTTYNYNLTGTLELQSETLPSGFFGDMEIKRAYDTAGGKVGRYNELKAGPAASPTYDISYGYEAATGRMNMAWVFTYNYLASSNLIQSTTQSAWGFTDARGYDACHDWMSSRTTTIASTTKAAFAYTPDPIGRTTDVVKTGEIFNRYGTGTDGLKTTTGYNDRSEVTSETTTQGTAFSTALPGRQDAYLFDQLGNRTSTTHNLTTSTWVSNDLNEVKTIDAPGTFDVAGGALSTSSVTVSDPVTGGPFSTSRFGQYFFEKHSIDNSSAAISRTLTVNAPGSTPSSTTIATFLPHNNYSRNYDDDGNLTDDGHWKYTYDAENRLISMETMAALCPTIIAYGDARRLEFTYDYLGRRVEKIVRAGFNGSSYTSVSLDTKFVYDGWNVIYELNALASNAYVRCNVWGLDQSGTLQGAGGVGGLLATYEFANGIWAIPMYDAMGNVHGLINSGTGDVMAAYEYDAFGNTLRESGAYAENNPFRSSTKYTDVETGLVYYGHRYYSPSLGKFINRDPIEESGGLNLYGFCGNNGVNGYDYLGMVYPPAGATWSITHGPDGSTTQTLTATYNDIDAGQVVGAGTASIELSIWNGTSEGDVISFAKTDPAIGYKIAKTYDGTALVTFTTPLGNSPAYVQEKITPSTNPKENPKDPTSNFTPNYVQSDVPDYNPSNPGTPNNSGPSFTNRALNWMTDGMWGYDRRSDEMALNFTDKAMSPVVDNIPVLNLYKSSVELGTGEDPISGAEVGKTGAIFGILLSAFDLNELHSLNGAIHLPGALSKSSWGWIGTPAWKQAVRVVEAGNSNGIIRSIAGKVPTYDEAIRLIRDAKGVVQRVDDSHAGSLVAGHIDFPHINYTTASGQRMHLEFR